MFACRAWTTVGPTSGIIASAAAAKRSATSRSLSPGWVRVRITSSRLASAIRAAPIPIVRATCSIPSSGRPASRKAFIRRAASRSASVPRGSSGSV